MTDAPQPERGPVRVGAFLALAALAVVIGLAFQGTRGLYESSETRYAECAREMMAGGDWLQPTLRGQPHWTKPPLTYWAIAGGMRLLGRNEWGARLYGAAAFVLATVGVALLGRALWDERAGLAAGLIYATSPFVLGAANVVTTDVLLTLWEVLAVLAYWRARRAATPRGAGVWMVAMWVAFGLGFFTKEPPALLPLVAIIPLHVWMRRRGRPGPRLVSLAGLALFVALGLWWYAVVALGHPRLMDYFLGDEVLDRLTTNRFGRNPEWYMPFALYLPPLAFGIGLWIVFWPGLLWRVVGEGRLQGLKRWLADRPETVFLVLWLLLPLLILSVVPSHLPLYVLPLMAVPALATARGLACRAAGPGLGRAVWAIALTSAVLGIVGKGVLGRLPNRHDSRPLAVAMLAQAEPGARFAVADRPEKYGLDFYLDGRVTRLASRQPRGDVFDDDVAGLVRTLGTPDRSAWVIAIEADAAPVTDALDHAGIPYVRAPGWRKYGLVVIPPG
ncbi:MAG TPA: glycosyltransferase family 39 protein [Phycisphaerae bacterium]|nr:glycosyltransferase family 39 protein [Phycisphaerae bacterium]